MRALVTRIYCEDGSLRMLADNWMGSIVTENYGDHETLRVFAGGKEVCILDHPHVDFKPDGWIDISGRECVVSGREFVDGGSWRQTLRVLPLPEE